MGFKKISEDCSDLYDIGVNILDGKYSITSTAEKILSEVFTAEYGEEGWEWVSWFIFESNYGEKDWSSGPCYDSEGNLLYEKGEVRYGAIDEKGNPICYSYESTWEYLEKNFSKNEK
jgi:hypothetical protein